MRFGLVVSTMAAILVAPLSAIASNIALPPLGGTHAVGKVSYQLTDPTREERFTKDPSDRRNIGVQIWYPRDSTTSDEFPAYLEGVAQKDLLDAKVPAAIIPELRSLKTRSIPNAPIKSGTEKYPLLVFSPGYGGNFPRTHLLQIEELASHGYVVMGLIHLDPQTKITRKAINAALKERVSDVQYLLQSLQQNTASQSSIVQRIDFQRLGILGHSMGGTTAAEVMYRNHRFNAGISLDGQGSRSVAQQGLSKPFMLINQYHMSMNEPTQENIYQRSRNQTYSVSFKGAAHDAFTDIPFLASLFPQYNFDPLLSPLPAIPGDPNPRRLNPLRTMQQINDYTLAFFERHLKGKAVPLLNQPSSVPTVVYKYRNDYQR